MRVIHFWSTWARILIFLAYSRIKSLISSTIRHFKIKNVQRFCHYNSFESLNTFTNVLLVTSKCQQALTFQSPHAFLNEKAFQWDACCPLVSQADWRGGLSKPPGYRSLSWMQTPWCRPPQMHTPCSCDMWCMLGSQPPLDRMTDTCDNITLPQTSFAGGNK